MSVVTVKYYSIFCIAAKYCREEKIELEGERNVQELVDFLGSKYGEDFQKKVTDNQNRLRFTAWILINGQRIHNDQLDRRLMDEDIVIFTTPILVGG